MPNNNLRAAVDGGVFAELRAANCDGCKGFTGPDDDCPDTCDRMQAALAVEVLGLSEHWDGSLLSPFALQAEAQTELLVGLAKAKLAWPLQDGGVSK